MNLKKSSALGTWGCARDGIFKTKEHITSNSTHIYLGPI